MLRDIVDYSLIPQLPTPPPPPPPPPPQKLREHTMWRSMRRARLGCSACQGHLSATLPGEAGPFPTWAKVAIALGFVGTAALVISAIVRERKYG